jgi:predicted nucleic acid-binding protein
MYIFYTAGSYAKPIIRTYANVFNNAIRNNACIFLPSIFISEFINAYIRAEYKRYLHCNGLNATSFDFKKKYKKLQDYIITVQDVSNIVNNQLLSMCYKLDDNFSTIDITNIFENEPNFDFNDRYYIELAKKNNLKIVTNDADFLVDDQVDIITYNSVLLSKINVQV